MRSNILPKEDERMSQKWYGWKGTILRVNLTDRKVTKQELPLTWARNYIGCRGLNSKILFDEVKADTQALSAENKLIFGTGPLEGTPIGMGRMSATTKAVNGRLGEGGLGGFFGPELKFAGYDFVVVEGKSDTPVYIWIKDEEVKIREAAHIWGKTTWETERIIKDELGDQDIQIRSIGPAGENLVHAAVLIGNLNRSGGRAGFGEVMGFKKLKAVAVRGSGGVQIAHPDDFEETYGRIRKELDLKKSPDMWTAAWGIMGGGMLARIFSQLGNLQTFNAQRMRWDEHADDIGIEAIMTVCDVRPKSCFCCPYPSATKWFEIKEGPYSGTVGENSSALELFFTSILGISYVPAALKAHSLCNQLGVDAFQAAYSIGWAMECYQKGILSKGDMDGLELKFGNYEAMLEMIRKIAYREGFGDVLADGVAEASHKVGKGSERFALTIKGQELEGMPQRNFYTAALGLATSEAGPDHTRWYPPYPCHPAVVSPEVLKSLNVDIDLASAFIPRKAEGKGGLLKWLTTSRAILESLPFCVFAIRGTLGIDLRVWRDAIEAGTGMDLTYEELIAAGDRIMNLERAFIVREGFRREDDTLPRRMLEEAVPDCHYGPLTQETLDGMLDEYYEARGWEKKTAIPRRGKLEELGLKEVIDEFEQLGIQER